MIRGEPLRLKQLCKHYGSARAVHEVSVDIEAGEFVSFLGPSGSGKTTTLMMVAGFETPTSGQIFVGSRPVTNLPVHKRDIGVVFQSYALFPHLSVFENVAFALKMRGKTGSELKAGVSEALQAVQLDGFEQRMPHQLSGGQQQRVALARALVFRPGVVLMDEPLGALDKQLREHMQIELKRLQKSLGTTMVFVTHDQSEALTMSDRIVVMNNGQVEQVGTPEEIYEDPNTRFVASFIGESNFVDAQVVQMTDSGPLLDIGGLKVRAAAQDIERQPKSVTLMIRPEKVIPIANGMRADNEFEGVVQEAIYWGNVVKYRILLPASRPIVLTASVPFHAMSPRFDVDDRIKIGWDARDGRLLLDETLDNASATLQSNQMGLSTLQLSTGAH
ncbi:ABC transporter ATP-binding protein [Paraburkholderia phenoliruptrix]|uniref:ABC transporter ATP-binding protein n=1 Tax=Paraburkholderia phenoliruptrix TaxID=252970 RepID=UPI002869CCBA|nr:ABC transporter ATP-binding protein [Paraburkholderia phenoliruptrix]WMY10894.1 ABC transporter ATP-binding protein [Paraburkholderia phenoliruptrix]